MHRITRTAGRFLSFIMLVGVFAPGAAQAVDWDGGSADDSLWGTAANWNPDGVPGAGATLVFPAGAARQNGPFNNLTTVFGAIHITGGSYTIGGTQNPNMGGVAPHILVSGGGPHNFSVNPTFSGPVPTIEVGSGLTLNMVYTLSGSISITKTGDGTLRLDSDANQYTGDLNILAGTVKLNNHNVIPNKANYNNAGNVTVDGTLDLNTFGETINGLNGSGIVDTIAGGTPHLTLGDNNANGTFSGIIRDSSGTLRVTKTGNGTQTLSGANDYAGITEVTAGILEVTHGGALGTQANGGEIRFSSTTTELRLTGGITILNDNYVRGSGMFNSVSGDNVFPGLFEDNGMMQVKATSGKLTLTAVDTDPASNGPWGFLFSGAGDIQVNGQLNFQSQALTKGTNSTDTGTLIFIGDNTGGNGAWHVYGIKVNCGKLRVTSPGILPSRVLVGGPFAQFAGSPFPAFGTSFGTPTLEGNGTLTGPVTIYGPSAPSVAGTIAGANGSTLTLQGGLDLQSGSKSTFDLAGAPSGDGIRVTGGSFSVSATHTITIANGTQSGTYTLFSTDGSPGNPGIGNMTLDVAGSDPDFTYSALFVSGNNIQVTLTAVMAPTGFLLIVQ